MKKRNLLKKAAATLMATGLLLSMAACGNGDSGSTEAASGTTGAAAETKAEDTGTTAAAAAEGETKADGEKYRIGLSMGTSNTEFCMKVMAEVQNACDANPDVELTTLSADSDANTQVTNIDNLVTSGVDAILVYPVDPEICADAMKRARDAGIHVVIVDQMPSDTDSFDVGISVSMHDLGAGVNEMASDWIDATFPDAEDGSVKVGVLGLWSTEQFAERCDVFNEIADYNPKAVVCESYDHNASNFATETAQNVEILLQKHPDINAILCFTDTQATIAEEAIQKNKDAINLNTDEIGIFTVDHSTASFELLGRSADGESCLRGIVTTNLAVGQLMYDCAMKDYDANELADGKILYQDIYKIDTTNMADYEQYILN